VSRHEFITQGRKRKAMTLFDDIATGDDVLS